MRNGWRWAAELLACAACAFALGSCAAGRRAASGGDEGRPPLSVTALAVLPFFHRGDHAEGCRVLEAEVERALRRRKTFRIVGPKESLRILQEREMLSDYLRFQSEFRRRGQFEHSLIEANAVLGVPALLLGEVLSYRAGPEPDGGQAAAVGASLLLLDGFTAIVWQTSKVVSERDAGVADLPRLAGKVAEELVESMPY